MSYVSKREKVFDLPEQEAETSTISLQNTETRLKRFPSVSDRRAWTNEECQRYQHLYGLINGSESSVSKSSSFKYIPFDVLLGILMAEKDAYIQELLDRQDDKSSSGGKASVLYKADGFEDSDDDRDALIRKDAEMVALKNKISGLESELDDYRDTLTKAMHKLENMDNIMSENALLREKLKYSEETIACLEERKKELEQELQQYRRSSESESDDTEEAHYQRRERRTEEGNWTSEKIKQLLAERNLLQQQVEDLLKELGAVKQATAEMQVLHKISETASISLEEMSRENECYRKKLETMKYLEKHIIDLKKEAQTLTDKYKRESQKANDHLKQINMSTKELQTLREERDKLQKRVEELVPFESQYISLQSKLHQVEMILDENELLNKKLVQLDRLELENEHLKMKIDQLQDTEIQAAKDKEKIIQLQCEVVDQEEEIRKMLRQIEDLTDGYPDRNEIYRLKSDLEDKNSKLKQYERQLTEIPVLESEIEHLRNKLQKCIDDFKTDKDLLRRLQEELEACRSRCHELEESAPIYTVEQKVKSKESVLCFDQLGPVTRMSVTSKGVGWQNTETIAMRDAESQFHLTLCTEKCTETLLNKSQHHSLEELQELEERNRILKIEVEQLRSKLSEINIDDFLQQTNEMKNLLMVKEDKLNRLELVIGDLKDEIKAHGDIDELKRNRDDLSTQVTNLTEVNEKLEQEMKLVKETAQQAEELEKALKLEIKARHFALNLVKELEGKLTEEKIRKEREETVTKLHKEEANMARQELYIIFSMEIDFWKNCKQLSDKVIKELKMENLLLRELKEYSDKVETIALKGLIKKLRAKVKALKSLSKPDIQAEYESVQEKVRLLLKETDTLMGEINDLKTALDAEKKAKDFLEKEMIELQAEITACLSAGSQVLDKEVSAKEAAMQELKNELTDVQRKLENSENEVRSLRDENVGLIKDCCSLKSEKETLMQEISQLSQQITEQKCLESEINRLSEQIEKQKDAELEFKQLYSQMEGRKSLESELMLLSVRAEEDKDVKFQLLRQSVIIEEQKKKIIQQEDKEKEYLNEIIALKTSQGDYKSDLQKFRSLEEKLLQKIGSLEDEVKLKEEEIVAQKQSRADMETEMRKWNSDVEALKSRLLDKVTDDEYACSEMQVCEADLKETLAAEKKFDFTEKYELDEAVRKIENKLDEFKTKLNDHKAMEEEMNVLRTDRDNLLAKTIEYEAEIKLLNNKIVDLQMLENEIQQLKAEQTSLIDTEEVSQEISSIQEELERNKQQVERLQAENASLRGELSKDDDITELTKKLSKTMSPTQQMPSAVGFYTPPAVPSPRDSSETEATISLDVHQRELTEVENHFRIKMQKLKQGNAKKVKKLTLYHEREAKFRSKAFHDSLNGMKSGYENGIKKLVEKHKVSIAKLQELHQEEVEELNKSYETQMDAMEKQNQNLLKDIQHDYTEKCKSMAEQHNRDLKALETKYEMSLQAKQEEIEAERANAAANLTRDTTNLEDSHKQTVDNLTQFYQSSILEMEEKHTKELKQCKKNNLKRIELMKNTYENLLVEERKKYEEQLEDMLHRLKNGNIPQASDSMMENLGSALNVTPINIDDQKRAPASSARLEFTEILRKIINEGLQSLTFDELITVHAKTCFVPEEDIDEKGGGELNDTCRHKVFMAAEKEELLKRIFKLEREMIIKELETHEASSNRTQRRNIDKIVNSAPHVELVSSSNGISVVQVRIESTTRVQFSDPARVSDESMSSCFGKPMIVEQLVNMEAAEKHRIQELSNALCNTQQKYYELRRHLSNQSKIQMDMKIEKYILDRQASLNETNVIEKTKELEREKAEKKRLEEELQKERANLKNLAITLESEKARFISQREKDLDYVNSIRERLEEALTHEQVMESQLDQEAKFRAKLESELQALQKNFNYLTDSVPPLVDPKAVKDLRNFDQCESTKKKFTTGAAETETKPIRRFSTTSAECEPQKNFLTTLKRPSHLPNLLF
ncbi:hypothetical protein RUM43_009591 [Polyplax serrata]|uniref:Uncharacterized protein n=1 Tax=Polyplax serrata TaxID=468196 RepID=A0AAN8PIM6_POLSC